MDDTDSVRTVSHDSDMFDLQMKNMVDTNLPASLHNLHQVAVSDPPGISSVIRTSIRELVTGGTSSPASIDASAHIVYDNQMDSANYMINESVIDENIDKFYADETTSRPIYTELTLLILYVKSQKHLYKRAASYYRVQQNITVVPTIILSTAATLMSIYSASNPIIHILVTVINAVIAFLVALLRYFSPETKAKTCVFMANSLHGLETKLNLMQYKMSSTHSNNRDAVQEVEQHMDELTKLHKVVIPPPVYYIMPIISYISIFTFIRYINEYKYDLYTQYLNIKIEIKRIQQYWVTHGISIYPECNTEQFIRLTADLRQKIVADIDRIRRIEYIKDGVKEKLTLYRDAYHNIDELYSSEIRFAESHNVIYYYFFGKKKEFRRSYHPVIQRVLDTYDLTNITTQQA